MDERSTLIESESERATGGHPRPPVPGRGLATAVLLLAACQAYEPSPLDPAGHRESWHARTLDDASILDFVERLDRAAGRPVADFDPTDGLSLREGQLVAHVFNPSLRLARLGSGRAAAGAEHAGLWADPQFELSVLRISESVPDRWVVGPALTFAIPLSGRLDTERRLAAAERRSAEHRALEAEWAVWHDVRRAWVEWSAALLRAEETERLVGSMEPLVSAATELADRGEVRRTEASLFTLERARLRNRLRRLRGDVAVAEQRLRAHMGLSPAAPVVLLPSLEVALDGAEDGGRPGPDAIAERNPSLARLRVEYDVAEEKLAREIAKQIPDLSLGPQYEDDEGQSRWGFLGAIPIPWWNANRRAIAEASVDREVARAQLETAYEALVGRWAAAVARASASAEQRADLEGVLVPLVERQMEDAVELMRLGEGSNLVLLESLTRAHDTKLELIEIRSAEALARTEIEYLTGSLAPRATDDATGDAKEETP